MGGNSYFIHFLPSDVFRFSQAAFLDTSSCGTPNKSVYSSVVCCPAVSRKKKKKKKKKSAVNTKPASIHPPRNLRRHAGRSGTSCRPTAVSQQYERITKSLNIHVVRPHVAGDICNNYPKPRSATSMNIEQPPRAE